MYPKEVIYFNEIKMNQIFKENCYFYYLDCITVHGLQAKAEIFRAK